MLSTPSRLSAILALLIFSTLALAQQADISTSKPTQNQTRPSATLSKTSLSPVLDGILDDEIWKHATLITDLHQTLPVDHGAPSRKSEFYVTYSDDYFYVAARLYDDPEQIQARQLLQDGNLNFDDNVEILLDTFNNARTAFFFLTNPNGIRRDGVWESPSSSNNDWTGIWQVESRIDELGWTTEIAIPFVTLNFDPATSEWGFNLGRAISRTNEKIYWSSFNREANPATAGVITGIEDLKQGLGLDIVPSITMSRTQDHIDELSENDFEPSLDVFYKFTPNLTGVVTLNTDFSATEADNRQVNLTRFSLFFPEKRDFFLQDSEIFTFGANGGIGFSQPQNAIPFYSRRIGLDPVTGQPIGLDVGGKLAGRIGPISVGGLVVQQSDSPGLPGQDVAVARVTSNVLSESKVGAIFTSGDPNSEVDNSLMGADFSYRNTRFSEAYTLTSNVWYQQTDTTGLDGDDKAYNFDISMNTQNTGVSGVFNYSYIGADYNPALGFANRRGVEKILLMSNYNYFPSDNKFLRQMFGLVQISQIRNIESKKLESESVSFVPFSWNTHRGDRYNVFFFREKENLTRPFEIWPGIIIPVGDYSFDSTQLNLLTSNQRNFSPDLTYTTGDFYDGKKQQVQAQLAWNPNKNLAFNFSYTYADVDLPQGSFVTRLISMNADIAFNAKWSWLNLLQYDNRSKSVGLNSRLNWNPKAGENLYLVINYNFDSSAGAFRELDPVISNLTLKYTKNFRF